MLNKRIHVPRVLNALFALFAICLTYSPVFAQHNPDSTEIQRRIAHLVHERFGIRGTIDARGIILGLTGNRLNAGLMGQDPIERGYQFFERNADLFQFANPRQELAAYKRMSRNGRSGTVDYIQMADSVPVIGSGYSVHFIPDSLTFFKIYTMSGDFFPEARSINTTPAISQAYAESLGLNDPEHGEFINRVFVGAPSKLIIDNVDGSLKLIWKVDIINGRLYGDADYWIDANTGAILKVAMGTIW